MLCIGRLKAACRRTLPWRVVWRDCFLGPTRHRHSSRHRHRIYEEKTTDVSSIGRRRWNRWSKRVRRSTSPKHRWSSCCRGEKSEENLALQVNWLTSSAGVGRHQSTGGCRLKGADHSIQVGKSRKTVPQALLRVWHLRRHPPHHGYGHIQSGGRDQHDPNAIMFGVRGLLNFGQTHSKRFRDHRIMWRWRRQRLSSGRMTVRI